MKRSIAALMISVLVLSSFLACERLKPVPEVISPDPAILSDYLGVRSKARHARSPPYFLKRAVSEEALAQPVTGCPNPNVTCNGIKSTTGTFGGEVTAMSVHTTGAISAGGMAGSTDGWLGSANASSMALWLLQDGVTPTLINYSLSGDSTTTYLGANSLNCVWSTKACTFQGAITGAGHVDITGVNAGNYGLGFTTGTDGICFNGTGSAGCTLGMQWNSATGAISLIETSGYFSHSTAVGTPASGTGITANYSGALRQWVHKVTVTSAAMTAAATTDVTLAVTPVNSAIRRVVADVTTTFTGGALTAVTVTCGKTAGGNEYLLSNSFFTAQNTWGDVVAEMGAGVVSATLADFGTVAAGVPGAITVQCRFTCTTANCNAATQGSATFYVEGVTY